MDGSSVAPGAQYPDEYAQATRDKGERAEAAPQIVLGVAVGAVKPGADEG